jgi:POT family proton-dependent oligopeptide transporter
MLFGAEFRERFAYYGMRALLAVYAATAFFSLLPDGEARAQVSLAYGAYIALIYATGIFGGFVADRYLGYRPSILLGGTLMAAGLFRRARWRRAPQRCCWAGCCGYRWSF